MTNKQISKFFSDKAKQYWKEIPTGERSERMKKIREGVKPWMVNHSPEERRAHALKMLKAKQNKKLNKKGGGI